MDFLRLDHPFSGKNIKPNSCYLINDKWDDFGYKTSFSVVLCDFHGNTHDVGALKVLIRDFPGGRIPLPQRFTQLGEEWCSLGTDRDYYAKLSELDLEFRTAYLKSIRDCVYDPLIFEAFRNQEGMRTSLLRGVNERDVISTFPRVLSGSTRGNAYNFSFRFNSGSKINSCEFEVDPNSKPPTNVHVLIGRNGVGKTRLLAGMADALTGNESSSFGLNGDFTFDEIFEKEFLNLIVVAYSAFDKFDPIVIGGRKSRYSLPYYYIGIKAKRNPSQPSEVTSTVSLKTSEDFNKEFRESLDAVQRDTGKKKRWFKAIEILSSDPGIADFKLRIDANDQGVADLDQSLEQFSIASSGHKIVLLSITRLVEHVSERSLALLDEPETHLHPPLLGSFIRAVSELLISQNGVAIVATHSPVVLQEVPAKCVQVVTRSGEEMLVTRPDVETFGENVGALTRKVFALEVTQSGFYKLLKDASTGRDFDQILDEFGQQIGGEGRALARFFASEGK